MGRANNTSRSLQIISRQQGWDPNCIEDLDGTLGGNKYLTDVGYRAREGPYDHSSTQDPFIGDRNDPQQKFPTLSAPGGDTRGQTRDRGPKGDPYPGKPGSRPARGGR